MERPKIKDKRFCSNCGSDKTYIDKKGVHAWCSREGNWYCNKCYQKLVNHPRWYKKNKEKVKISVREYQKTHPEMTKKHYEKMNAKQLIYTPTGKRIYVKEPRKGICSECGAKKGDEFINCYGKKTKVITMLHHLEYHDDDPLKDTIELCARCHRLKHV